MVSGPPGEPNYPEGSSIGASLRALHTGIELQEPDGKGDFDEVLVRGWLTVVSADFPAAAILTGTMVGTSANRFCRCCCVDRREEGFDCPCSFLNPDDSTPEPRTLEGRAADMEHCGDCESEMANAGWKSWSHAFARCGPFFDYLKQCPYDLMHVEPEGLLKGECAHFIFYCIRVKQWFDIDKLNAALDAYSFPGGGKQVPYFGEGLLKGKGAAKQAAKRAKTASATTTPGESKFVPSSGCHVHMTAGQMLTFSQHSVQIFLGLGVPWDDPAFTAWRTHLTYMSICMQHRITKEEIQEIDQVGNRPACLTVATCSMCETAEPSHCYPVP